MQQVNYSYTTTLIQKLFVEKVLESLYIGTLDSYRLRLHNPKTAIEELIHVTLQVKQNILQRQEYVVEICKEVTALLKDESDGLIFTSISKDYYLKLIQGSKKENFNVIIQASRLVIKDNTNYQQHLIDEIERCINDYVEGHEIEAPEKLLSLVEFSLIELINKGFTKQYLYNCLRTILVHAGGSAFSFNERFQEYKNFFTKPKSSYTVIFKILSNKFQFRELHQIDNQYIHVNRRFRSIHSSLVSDRVARFLEENKEEKLIAYKIDAPDHFKAIELCRAKLSRDLDLYHLGFSGIKNSIDKLDFSHLQRQM